MVSRDRRDPLVRCYKKLGNKEQDPGMYEKLVKMILTNFRSTILDTMKVLAIYLVNEWMGAKWTVFSSWAHKRPP